MINDESGEIQLEKKIYTQAEVEAMDDAEITLNLETIISMTKFLEEAEEFVKEIMITDFGFDLYNSTKKQLKIVQANFCIFKYVQLVRFAKKL